MMLAVTASLWLAVRTDVMPGALDASSPADDSTPSPAVILSSSLSPPLQPASLHLGRDGILEGGTATDRCALNHPPDPPSKRAASSLTRSARAALRGSSGGSDDASANTRCRSK